MRCVALCAAPFRIDLANPKRDGPSRRAFAKNGGAILLPQREVSPSTLAKRGGALFGRDHRAFESGGQIDSHRCVASVVAAESAYRFVIEHDPQRPGPR